MGRIIRTFAQHQAMLVHYGVIAVDIGIGMGNFRDLSQRLCLLLSRIRVGRRPLRCNQARVGVAFVLRQVVPGDGGRIHLPHRPGGMILRRHINDVGIAGECIVGMGDIGAAVGGCSLCHNGRGARISAGCGKADNTQRNRYNYGFFFHSTPPR